VLVGSTNMQLQGMNVNPRDLDIVVQLSNLEKISRIFNAPINKLRSSTKEPAWEVKTTIDDVEIQIFGERDLGKYVSKLLANRIIKMKLEDIEVPCFTLEAEAQAYEETKRENKAQMIRNFLQN